MNARFTVPANDPACQRAPSPSRRIRPCRSDGRSQHGTAHQRGTGRRSAVQAPESLDLPVGQFTETKARIDTIPADLRRRLDFVATATQDRYAWYRADRGPLSGGHVAGRVRLPIGLRPVGLAGSDTRAAFQRCKEVAVRLPCSDGGMECLLAVQDRWWTS